MSKASGSKMSVGEYAIRTSIDVAAKTIVPLTTAASAYVVYFHGHDIAAWIKKKNQDRKVKRESK